MAPRMKGHQSFASIFIWMVNPGDRKIEGVVIISIAIDVLLRVVVLWLLKRRFGLLDLHQVFIILVASNCSW